MPTKVSRSAGEKKAITEVPLVDLKTHSLQEEMFGGVDLDIDSLIADIEAFGLREPIKILPDLTIVCGHRRVEAFRRLGRPTIPAVVLDNMTKIEVDRLLVSDNFHRRQLEPLAKARCAAKLFELTEQKDSQLGGHAGRGARLQAVAAILGCCSKEVMRYLDVLDAPLEVQRAYESKRVSLVDAGAIGRLPDRLKVEAVAAIRAGESPKPFIRQANVDRRASTASKMQQYRKQLRSLGAACVQLDELADCGLTFETLAPQRVSNLTQYIATLNKLLILETSQGSRDATTSEDVPPKGIVRTPPSRVLVGHDVPRAPVGNETNK